MPIRTRDYLVAALILLLACQVFAAEQPNILIVMADDCTHSDLPIYGGKNAATPNIDKLASEGLVFNKAYLSEAMCQPCRAELFSGKYPLSNGCAWNHSASIPTIKSLPHYLGKIGYRTGIAGKVHVKPAKAFPFEDVPGFDPNCVRNPTRPHDLTATRDFFTDKAKPFCLVVALVEPHVPWVMGDASQYPPAKIKLPPNIADTPRTREDFGKYLAEITYMDSQVGEILTALDETGQAENTLVLFTSEQGSQFPGCKWTNWDTGVHTALIARWPKKVAPGTRTNALVQYADVLPTIMDAANAELPDEVVDGESFLRVVLGQSKTHREFVFGCHNNIPEGPAYPVRTVSDGEYRYIQNLLPEEIYIEKHLMGSKGNGALNNPYWSTWVFEAWNNERTYDLVKRYTRRPPEQFYHTARDPYELDNLIATTKTDSGLATRKTKLADALAKWMESQGDPGIAQDTDNAIRAARQGKHLYGPHLPN